MKRVAILGSTGSIGTQTLEIVRRHRDRLRVVGLAAHSNAAMLADQAAEFAPVRLALYDEAAATAAGIPGGMSALIECAVSDDVDMVVVAVAGVIGLVPTIQAIRAGKTIALASKEVLVAAGEVVMPLARAHGSQMLPIDSEHSAIFQCLQARPPDSGAESIRRLILTASGGPFRGKSKAELEAITPEQALAHPTWRMGGKITVDSATLMNKGLETIEAMALFGVPLEKIDVVVHPQSIVHSFVEFADGSVLGQLGWPDMRLPIQVALLHPDRVENALPVWDPVRTPHLTFEPPDLDAFPCLELARESARLGGTMPCVMNAANEESANAFLRGEIGFMQIPRTVEAVMARHQPESPLLERLIEADDWARETARSLWRTTPVHG